MAASTSSAPRTLLVVSGGREAVPAIREAQPWLSKSLGLCGGETASDRRENRRKRERARQADDDAPD